MKTNNTKNPRTLQQRWGLTQTKRVLIALCIALAILGTACKKDKKPGTAEEKPAIYVNKGEVSTFAGSGEAAFLDETGDKAKFQSPRGIAVDKDGNLYIADAENHSIRKITKDGVVKTFAGTGTPGFSDTQPGVPAKFNQPAGVAVDGQGTVYVADRDNHRIRRITKDGVVSTLAGDGKKDDNMGTGGGFLNGQAATAKFNKPTGVAVDADGVVYVADLFNHRIRKIIKQSLGIGTILMVSTLAGSVNADGSGGDAEGTETAAKFNYPVGVAVDAQGMVYVADTYNHKIRKITKEGVVTTFAGSSSGWEDKTGTDAKFYYPRALAVDAGGNVYVADTDNHRIRKITKDGAVSTLAGSGYVPDGAEWHVGGFLNGKGTDARFDTPYGVAVAADGRVYVADMDNNRIRKIE